MALPCGCQSGSTTIRVPVRRRRLLLGKRSNNVLAAVGRCETPPEQFSPVVSRRSAAARPQEILLVEQLRELHYTKLTN